MEKYKELGSVERAFDKIKNSLDIRPVYHYKPRRVKGHIFLCNLGLLVHSLVERLTEESSERIIKGAGKDSCKLSQGAFHVEKC